MGYRIRTAVAAVLLAAACLGAEGSALREAGTGAPPSPEPKAPPALETIRKQAVALAPGARSDLVREFLKAANDLPSIPPRRLFRDESKTRYFTETEAASLPDEQRKPLSEVEVGESYYYNTRYGTPLAYSRPLEILAAAGLTGLAGKRVLDFGYGSIGHLRLMAIEGAEAVGVEVDPLLRALYAAPGDQGAVRGRHGRDGSVRLIDGRFPADGPVREAVGSGYDLILSKNVLKNGYLHPERPVDERRLVRLGVDDGAFVRALHDALKPGGLLLIYNLCPAPAPPDKPYVPWADGRSPFPRSMWEEAGFRIIAFDADDSAAARAMAGVLGWDKGVGAMDLEKDLFGTYTLVERMDAPAAK